MDHSRDKLSDNDMGGVEAAFTTDEKSKGAFGAHSITSFQNDLKLLLLHFYKEGLVKTQLILLLRQCKKNIM